MSRTLADVTTLQVGGPAHEWVIATTEDELVAAVTSLDSRDVPVLLLGGGSNLVVGDAGFPGAVVQVQTRGVEMRDVQVRDGAAEVLVDAAAGEPWDDVVQMCVAAGLAGIEALSGIPGRVGATPVQNVGAYGQEVSQVIESVRVLDRTTGAVDVLSAAECGFAYRDSAFKRAPECWVVLGVRFRLPRRGASPVGYAELARALGVGIGDVAAIADIRAAVLTLRAAKGMVTDPADRDTCSVGSFFMNPVVSLDVAERIPPGCPRYPADDGVKLSAAWLIEQSGVGKGFAVEPTSRARVSSKHTLALTNTGGASTNEVLELARAIVLRVDQTFGIRLQPEARLVACAL